MSCVEFHSRRFFSFGEIALMRRMEISGTRWRYFFNF